MYEKRGLSQRLTDKHFNKTFINCPCFYLLVNRQEDCRIWAEGKDIGRIWRNFIG